MQSPSIPRKCVHAVLGHRQRSGLRCRRRLARGLRTALPVDARIGSPYDFTYAGHTCSSLENQYVSTWPVDLNNGNPYDCTSHIEANTSWPHDTQHVVAHNTQHAVEWLEQCNSKEDIRAIVLKGFDGGHLPVNLCW